MNLKYTLSPIFAAGAAIWTRLTAAKSRFQTVILHDVRAEQYSALHRLLELIGRDHGFLTPNEAVGRLTATNEVGDGGARLPCLLTFDDGFNSAIPVARDILSRFDAKAVFFICPGLIDMPPDRQDHAVRANVFGGHTPRATVPRLLSWDEVDELQHAGHTIGAHGMMHLRLSTLTPADYPSEITAARLRLAEKLGSPPEWYAYAFGDIGSISAPALRNILADFQFCRSGIRGSNGPDNIPRILTAQEIDLDSPIKFQRAVLSGALDLRYLSARRRLSDYARIAAP